MKSPEKGWGGPEQGGRKEKAVGVRSLVGRCWLVHSEKMKNKTPTADHLGFGPCSDVKGGDVEARHTSKKVREDTATVPCQYEEKRENQGSVVE